jgi:2-phosphosulfolactate phosphatase
VVIDVLRAFTTTAHAFARGASEIVLVSTIEEAFELRERDANCLLAGEVNGLPIDGFDLPNSPSAIESLDLRDRRLVLRTTAGTQGVVLARQASQIFVASLCVATATAQNLLALDPDVVTFVETGVRTKGGGEEDIACADYIGSLLTGSVLDVAGIRNRVLESRAAAKFSATDSPDFPRADLERALQIDRFQFAMKVERVDNLLVLRSTANTRRPIRGTVVGDCPGIS